MGQNRGYIEERRVEHLPRIVMEREYTASDTYRFVLEGGTVMLFENGEKVGETTFTDFQIAFQEQFGDETPPPSEQIDQAEPVTKPTTGRYNHYAHFESDEGAREAAEIIEAHPEAELERDETSVKSEHETYLAWSE